VGSAAKELPSDTVRRLETFRWGQDNRRDIAAVAVLRSPCCRKPSIRLQINVVGAKNDHSGDFFFPKFGYRPILYSGYAEARVSSGARVIINCMFAGRTE
jgi:hypothetical protein